MNKLWWLIIIACLVLIAFNCFGDEIDDLIPHIIACESSGNQYAVSEDGCVGLMQISKWVLMEYNYYMRTQRIFPAYELQDLYNPVLNKAIGKWYLYRLKDHYLKDDYTVERMLAAYNGGISRLKKLLREGKDWQDMPDESVSYTKRVLKLYRRGGK